MKEETRYVIDQMIKEQQWQKDNGPIVKTADQLWKYSGEIEKDSQDYISMIIETTAVKLAAAAREYLTAKRYKSRKEYFKLHWLNQKQKINE